MLRASAKTPNGPLIICGITDGNILRLKDGHPIKAELRSFGVDLPGSLVIIHGTTEADIEQMMRSNGLVGPETHTTTDPRIDQEAEARAQHKHILIATVGLPRSGKTTWARSQSYPVVCPDAIRLALHGQRFQALAEPFVWASAKLMVRALFGAGHKIVILDATNTTKKRREEWVSANEWGLFLKHINTPVEVCRTRAALENDAEILPVIDRMAAQFEYPEKTDLLWV